MQKIPEAEALLERARELLMNLKIISLSPTHADAYLKKYGKTVWFSIASTEKAIYNLEEMCWGQRHEINTGPTQLGEIFSRNPENPSIR